MKRIILLLTISFLGLSAYSQEMDVVGNGGNTLAIRNGVGVSSTVWQSFYPSTPGTYQAFLQSHQNGNFDVAAKEDLRLWAGFVNRMTLKSGGNLGLGTSTPDGKMEINFNSGIGNPTLRLTESSTTDGARLTFSNDNASYFTLYGAPSATAANGTFNMFHSDAGNVTTWKGDGKVGIGETSPETKLHVSTGGVTIDHDNSTTDVINFKLNNPIASAGIKFNSSGGALLGGYLHAQTKSYLFRGSSPSAGLTMQSNNYIGLNNANPGVPLHIDYSNNVTNSSSGAFMIGSSGAAHLNFDNNELNAWNGSSGATLYLNFYSGEKVQIGRNSADVAGLDVNGFTNLGDGAPRIKMKKLTGTTAAAEGSSVNIPHGIGSSDKILSVDIAVEYSANSYVPENYTQTSNYEFNYYYNATNIIVINKSGNSSIILNDPIKILITYEE